MTLTAQQRVLRTATTWLLICAFMFPLYWMVVTAITPRELLFRSPKPLLPRQLSFENFAELLRATQFLTFLENSLVVAAGAVAITVVASTLAGYALSRLNFPLKRTFVGASLWSYMFPPILLAIPLYLIFSAIGLRNSYIGLILSHVSLSLPLTISIMLQYFQLVPVSLEEAAWVSGASRFRALVEICIPSVLPGMLSTAIFAFALSWNDFSFAFILQTNLDMFTLPVGLSTFVEQSAIHWGLIMSSSVLVSIPSLLLVFFLQRYMTPKGGPAGRR